MSLLSQFLLIAALIAGMIGFRLLADGLVARWRMRAGYTGGRCGNTGCFRDCDENDAADANDTDENTTKRSACRAP
ncbi:MAG: hypothetical protein KJO76_09375 [Gammaproteobacteria bacterium]|nr:hypothetical protein [Gammaproteobacteria bacterium]MBT8445237.1 hypothetical protein [Gammaproteobacteria bacterium]NND36633.1 hypothetical protein [Gammaproteobacteria bacterium]